MDWPIVVDEIVRDRLVERVTSQRARVQLISGPSGIGKSTLAASVAARLVASGHSILPIVGMPELKEVTLGAMAPLLATTGAPISESTSERLQRLFSLVSTAGSDQVLVVDDGPMLDEVSASTVYQLVRVYGVRCVMTARSEHPLTGPLLRLHDEGFVDVTELQGLDASVATNAVRAALGGPVEPESLRALVDLAGGNPLFLRELVLAVTRGGGIRQGRGGLIVDVTRLPAQLRDTIALRFEDLSHEERELAELIAIAEPWPEDLLPTPRLIDRLDGAGLVSRALDGEIYLSHPLFAETLIELMTDVQRDKRGVDAARRLLGGEREDHRFKAICLLAETSDPPTIGDLAWAAAYAHGVDDHALGIRLSTQSIQRALSSGESPSFEAFLVRADALSVSGRFDEADAAFADAEAATTTDAAKANVATRHGFHLAVRRQRPLDAVRIGTAIVGSLSEPSARAFLAANLAKWQLMAGEAPLALPQAGDSTEPVTVFNLELYRLTAAIFAGDLEAARTAIEAGRPRAEAARSVVRHGVELLDFAEFFVTALDGRIGEAIEYAEHKRGDFFEESVGMWNYGIALFTLHAGKADEALELASAAVEQLSWRDFLGARGAATALRATAAELLGRHELAADILESITPDARAYVATELQAAEATAWTLVNVGEDDAALAIIGRAVERGIDSHYYALAGFVAYLAVRIGRAEAVLHQLRTIASLSSGGLISAMLGHAEALAARDVPALLAAAEQLAAAGLRAGAAEAACQAGDIARADGRDRSARRAFLLASRWEEGLSGTRHHGRDAGPFMLTEREWLVASAAAGRERSKEIAGRLGLSARTIDNHLTNIYRKLGVSGRDELRRELAVLGRD